MRLAKALTVMVRSRVPSARVVKERGEDFGVGWTSAVLGGVFGGGGRGSGLGVRTDDEAVAVVGGGGACEGGGAFDFGKGGDAGEEGGVEIGDEQRSG